MNAARMIAPQFIVLRLIDAAVMAMVAYTTSGRCRYVHTAYHTSASVLPTLGTFPRRPANRSARRCDRKPSTTQPATLIPTQGVN